jgi:hypothetical protein
MALEDEMAQSAPNPDDNKKLTKEENQDLKIAVALAERMIDDGGYDVIKQALDESNDPGQVIGQFLMQLVSQMDQNMPEDMKLSKRIYFAHNGWIEQVSDFLQDEYKVPRQVMDRAEMYIGAAAQKMAQGGAQQAAGQAPAQSGAAPAQPPMPQGGGVA